MKKLFLLFAIVFSINTYAQESKTFDVYYTHDAHFNLHSREWITDKVNQQTNMHITLDGMWTFVDGKLPMRLHLESSQPDGYKGGCYILNYKGYEYSSKEYVSVEYWVDTDGHWVKMVLYFFSQRPFRLLEFYFTDKNIQL